MYKDAHTHEAKPILFPFTISSRCQVHLHPLLLNKLQKQVVRFKLTLIEKGEKEKTTEIDKVVIMFKETGSAPALKQKKFKLQANATFQNVSDFLRKQLAFKKEDPLVSLKKNIQNGIC